MIKSRSKLDWQFMEDSEQEAVWPPHSSSCEERSGADRRQSLRLILFAITMVALLTAGIGTIYARNEAQTGIADVEQGVQAAVDAEQWVQKHAPELSAEMLIDDAGSDYVEWMIASEQHLLATIAQQESPQADLQVEDTHFEGRYAAADVTVTLSGVGEDTDARFRQTRFYHETPQGWLRTQPVPALWGQPRRLETKNLAWRYRQRDEDVVLAVADQIDDLYVQLLFDYGLANKPRSGKQVVDIRINYLPGRILLQGQPSSVVVAPSPAVYLRPQHLSDADILAQMVAIGLLENLWEQASSSHNISHENTVQVGLKLWQLRNMGMGLASGTWKGLLRPHGNQDLREACAAYAVWMLRPVTTGTPVHCDGARVSVLALRPSQMTGWSVQEIGWFHSEVDSFHNEGLADGLGHSVLATVIVDYAVDEYGRESLPHLLFALGKHDSWQTLVPAVYGVSLEEFENGWREHVIALQE